MPSLRLEGKVALITGAGGGMGGACARTYTDEGATVILLDHSQNHLQAVVNGLRDANYLVKEFTVDVCDELAVSDAVNQALATFGRIDILVNAAGAQGPGAPVWDVDPQEWRRTVDVNLWGTFLMCRSVLPQMVQRRYGRIINVSSGAGNNTMPYFSGYSAAKAGVTHFTRTIADELKPYGITANAIGVRGITRMWKDVLEAGPGGGSTTEGIRAQVASGMRPDVKENMPVFVFLASDESRHITGQYLEANSLPAYLIKPET